MSPRRKSRIRTLADLERAGDGDVDPKYHRPIPSLPYAAAASGSASRSKAFATPSSLPNNASFRFQVVSMTHLPNAAEALALLQRVCLEFQPILQRRGYNVKSVSEMCCCGDGLDDNDINGGGMQNQTKNKSRRRKRKRNIMGNNVLGYNQTTVLSAARTSGQKTKNKSHTIHLRLRHPQDHSRLYTYEHVAGTMAHELSHCEIGPHNDAFNKLMDDILEEHMILQCQQQQQSSGGTFRGSTGSSIMPTTTTTPFSGKGSVLGGGSDNKAMSSFGNNSSSGYKLGGDNVFSKYMSPKEAAVMAAEARRRQQILRARDRHCCQPCTITIPDNDDEEPIIEYASTATTSQTMPAPKKRLPDTKIPFVTTTTKDKANKVLSQKPSGDRKKSKSSVVHGVPPMQQQDKALVVVDLTSDDDATPKTELLGTTAQEWPCGACTFINPPMALMCSMCTTEKEAKK
jgi:DNA-dependent metalloprotease WSS1